MKNSLITIDNLSKVFPKKETPSLENINSSLPKGQIIGIVGPDGSGKTTLIRLIAALLLPTSGTISINGYDSVRDAEKIHALSGYMPQKFGLYEDLTVQQNLNLYANLRNLPKEEWSTTFQELLRFTDLASFTDRLVRDLSGGMKQKLGLACALIKKPTLLLLDEPSVGVDPISRRELWSMVEALVKEGITAIWSTAYLNEAENCSTILLLNEGKLLFYGTPATLTKKVEGRVFKITNIQGNRRNLLTKLRQDPSVLDGVIQGRDIRIVLKENAQAPQEITLEPLAPRFEDAFIDILGGASCSVSELAFHAEEIKGKGEDAVIAENLTKKFGSFTAADHISFTAKRGEIFGLLGPNGAGKSTTFKMLCGLLRPTSGKAVINGVDLQSAPAEARSHIGYMAQKFSLYGSLSVKQNLDFFASAYNLSNKAKKDAIDNMVTIFKLQPYFNLTAEMLPLGFKQRLSLACATMHHPKVLFLDEPTSGVDPITRREFWTHINGLVEKGVSVMVTTHFMDEAEYCDRVALIYRGKIIHIGTPDHLKEIAQTQEHPNPTLEDAFIKLIEEHGK
ncbi:MAG: ATP-binding cassette domain-containing protein [Chlamydiota bacterium]